MKNEEITIVPYVNMIALLFFANLLFFALGLMIGYVMGLRVVTG